MPSTSESTAVRPIPRAPLAGDRYRLDRELGTAGHVRTHLARDTVLDGEAVVRLATPALVAAAGGATRLSARLKRLAQIAHPAAVRPTDLGLHEGLPFAVCPRIAGTDLATLLRRAADAGRSLDPEALARRLAPVAGALDAIHAAGLVHGDVRPGSILFATDGGTHLADAMGGCPERTAGVDALDPARVASVAPEQVRGLAAGPASDQYALAVTLFEALTGRPPHQAVAPMAVAVERLSVEAPRLDALRADLPVALADTLARALDREPARRFPSCTAFIEAAARALSASHAPVAPPVVEPVVAAPLPTAAPIDASRTGADPRSASTRGPRKPGRRRPARRTPRPAAPRRRPRAGSERAARRAPASTGGLSIETLPAMIAAGVAGVAAACLPWVAFGPFTATAMDGDLSGIGILALSLATAVLVALGKRLPAHVAAWGVLALIGYDAARIIDQASFELIGWGLYVALAATGTALVTTLGRRPR